MKDNDIAMPKYPAKEYLMHEFQVPLCQVVTDYSPSDAGQLRTRIGAFVEMLQGKSQ